MSEHFPLRACLLDGARKCARCYAGHCVSVGRRFERAAALTRRLRILERGAIRQWAIRLGDAAVACAKMEAA